MFFISILEFAAGLGSSRNHHLCLCIPQALAEALDIFSAFFEAPLLRRDGSDREVLFDCVAADRYISLPHGQAVVASRRGLLRGQVSAIESEFARTKNSDSARLDELLCRAARPAGHPLGGFAWGNRASLVDEPAAAG